MIKTQRVLIKFRKTSANLMPAFFAASSSFARCVGVIAKLIFTLYASAPAPPARGLPPPRLPSAFLCPAALRLPRGAPCPAALRLPKRAITAPHLRDFGARLATGASSAAVADFAAVFGAVFGARVAIMPAMYAPAPARVKQKTRVRWYITARARLNSSGGVFCIFFFSQKALFFLVSRSEMITAPNRATA